MDSLYGSHMGVSFVLKGRYESIAAMVRAFKGGSNYTVIHYGEYVIIDTQNKNHIDNGKIYRRGYDYQNNMGGAEYIGQVVGPSSGNPYFQINDLDTTKKEAQREVDNELTYKRYPTGKDGDGRYTISENGDGSDIGVFDMTTKETLVPGKQGDLYNDTIKYTWVNIRDDTNAADSWFYVGFQIPYMVIDYKVHSVSPYDEDGNKQDTTTSERTDGFEHPFWEEWNIGIPKGIKGDTLRHLHIIIPTAEDEIYDLKNITTTVDELGNYKTVLGEKGYDNQQDDIDGGRAILVIEYTVFDNKAEGETVLVYVGDYNMIESVNVEDDGTLVVGYTHEDDSRFEKKIKWVVGCEVTDDGIITFKLNTGETIKLQTADGQDFHLKFIEDVKLETDIKKTKRIQVKYNTSEDYVAIGDPINYIKDMVVRASDWHLLVLYTDPEHRAQDETHEHGVELVDQYGHTWINGIKSSDGTVYDDDVYWEDMGTIKDQSGILVGFNVDWDDVVSAGKSDILEYLNDQYPDGLTGDEQYPGGPSTKDKIVTYGADPNSPKEFYAYDYNKDEWYYLGLIDGSENISWDIGYLEHIDDLNSIFKQIRSEGIIISPTEEDIVITESPLPLYWSVDYTSWAAA